MGVHLPGAPRARPVVKRDVDDDVVGSSRSRPDLDQAILDALKAGPLTTWQLHLALHETTHRLLKHLATLRGDTRVKTLGNARDRRYALRDWEDPDTDRAFNRPPINRPTVADLTPSSSWWTEVDSRESFARRLEAELPRMTKSSVLPTIRPLMLGGKLP